jgi:hypothetical protein
MKIFLPVPLESYWMALHIYEVMDHLEQWRGFKMFLMRWVAYSSPSNPGMGKIRPTDNVQLFLVAPYQLTRRERTVAANWVCTWRRKNCEQCVILYNFGGSRCWGFHLVQFRAMTLYILVGGYQHRKTAQCHNPEDCSILILMPTTETESVWGSFHMTIMHVLTPREHEFEL